MTLRNDTGAVLSGVRALPQQPLRWVNVDAIDPASATLSPGEARAFDLTFSVDATEMLTVSVGVNNLFDTLPTTPVFDANGVVINNTNSLLQGDFNNSEQANTYPSTYDVLGRDFFVSASFRF